MQKIFIEIFINQLGNLKIKWTIPESVFLKNNQINIQLPSYKYDLPKIAGLPVPFSSKAIPVEIKNISIQSEKYSTTFLLSEDFHGNNNLHIEVKDTKELKPNETITIFYEVASIVNSDGIFFVFVYPFISPFEHDSIYEINVQAKLSYVIREYKFREWYFDRKTGKKIKRKPVFNTNKDGDLFIVSTRELQIDSNTELNIHITGTRFPVMIRRDIFWIIIFIFSITVLLSPLWTAFLNWLTK